jgi:glutamine cyclotransferase
VSRGRRTTGAGGRRGGRRRWLPAALLVAVAGGLLVAALLARAPGSPAQRPAVAASSAAPATPAAPVAPAAPLAPAAPFAAERLRVKVLSVRPHDPAAYTQGLVWNRGTLYESAGLYGRSSLRQVDPKTGEVLRHADVPPRFFAEGLALVGNRLVQLTWKEGVAFVYDALSFGRVGEYHYDGEGWGLCDDGRRLVMSDGSDRLSFRDRRTFALLGGVNVRLEGRPVPQLNELECVGGEVYANVWTSEEIVRIDPASGQVSAVIDASGLLDAGERAHADVLNGIAYDPAKKTFLITGKLWPKLFEVVFVPTASGVPPGR